MTSLDHLEEPGGLAGERMANRKGLGYRELVKIKCKGYQGHTLIKLVNSIGICNAIMIEVHCHPTQTQFSQATGLTEFPRVRESSL